MVGRLDQKFDFSELAFIDVESCGLHVGAYPIEVGFANVDLEVESWLIRPHSSWSEWNWSFTSEKLHGITREQLLSDGVDVVETAQRLNQQLSGRIVLSDAPSFDEEWLFTLFSVAEVQMEFPVEMLDEAILAAACGHISVFERIEEIKPVVEAAFQRTHRAGDDALQNAAIWKATFDFDWFSDLKLTVQK